MISEVNTDLEIFNRIHTEGCFGFLVVRHRKNHIPTDKVLAKMLSRYEQHIIKSKYRLRNL